MSISLTQQVEAYRKFAPRAVILCQKSWERDAHHIIRLGEERLTGVGFEDYGDKSWWLTLNELNQNQREEQSDELVYQVIKLFRGHLR
jgi:hypothetical protein